MATRNDHQQTIRQSCNNCAQQKVRCSKERPRCTRCKNKGLECQYSFSRRTGRRSTASMPKIQDSSMDVSGLPSLVMEDTPFFDDSAFKSHPEFSDFGANLVPFDFSWGSPPNDSSDISSNSPTISPSASTTAFPQNLSLPNMWSDWQSLQPSRAASTATPPTPACAPPMPMPMAKHTMRQAASVHAAGQGCMTLALELISSLHVARESCMAAVVTPLHAPASKLEDTRDVDQVLFDNRDAIKALHQILDCSCARDPSILMTCNLVAAKIVAWYQDALGLTEKQFVAPGDDAAAFADRVVARPIFMGNYLLDAAASRSVRAGVILSELKEHMQPLLMRLQSMAHAAGSGASPVGSLDIGCGLRDQLRGTIEEASIISLGTA